MVSGDGAVGVSTGCSGTAVIAEAGELVASGASVVSGDGAIGVTGDG